MLGDLLSDDHQLTIADMEAGLEHLSRSGGTLRHVDILLVVLEPYKKALETARRTLQLATDLGIPRIYGVGSKVEDDQDREIVESFSKELGLELLAIVPYDEVARKADRNGQAVIDADPNSEAVTAVERLLDAIEEKMKISV
jgi:CO dehydrogenase maturation factor